MPRKRKRAPRVSASRATTAPDHDGLIWGGLLALALGLRALYVLSIRNAPFFTQLQTEPEHYDAWARAILTGAGTPVPPFEQAPGYPYFVAAVYALVGHTVLSVAVVQCVLSTATCLLIGLVASRRLGRRVGLLSAGVAACFGPLIYFCAELLPTTLFVFLVASALAVTPWPGLTASRGRRPRDPMARAAHHSWLLSGTLWGIAVFVRSEVVLAYPLVVWDAWYRGGRVALARSGGVLAFCAAALFVLNSAPAAEPVWLSTTGGVNLWLGNNPHADGVNPFIEEPLRIIDEMVRTQAATAAEADRLFRDRALAFWREQPSAALWLLWKKFLWTWTDCELPNTSDIDWQLSQSWLFATPFFPLRFGMLLPVAAAGGVLLWGLWRPRLLLLAPLVVGLGTSLIFFTNARFRVVMAPALVMLAAVTLDRLPAMRRAPVSQLVSASLAAAIGLLAAWSNPYGVRAYRIAQLTVNAGILEREAGHFDAALSLLHQGIGANPRDGIAWIHLALALEQTGRTRDALQAYFSALTMAESPDVAEMSARFFQRHGLDLMLLDDYVAAPNDTVRTDLAARATAALLGTGEPAP